VASGGFGFVAWQGADGDLQAEEEEAGAFEVEVVGGDAGDDLGDGELDGGSVFEDGEREGFEVGVEMVRGAGLRHRDRSAGGVVVEAEVFAAQGGGAAAASSEVDVAAVLTFLDGLVCLDVGLGCGLHCVFSTVMFFVKSSNNVG
jgi:hypothetical protein